MVTVELIIIIVLILLNGFLAMSELALVSSRRARLKTLAEQGRRGAAAALRLAEEPGRFLSTVQIGITLVGIFTGAFGGATLADELAVWLATFPALANVAGELAFGLVVALITYLSLILGELVPKQLALRAPETIAGFVAWPMMVIARLAAPLVWLLDASTGLVLRLLGSEAASRHTVTDEEIRALIAEAMQTGVVKHAEKDMLTRVMRLADQPVRALMTPRPDIVWLDLEDTPEAVGAAVRDNAYSAFPVGQGSIDEVLGIVQTKDLLDRCLRGEGLNLAAALQEPLLVHEDTPALRVLETLKHTPAHPVLVVDEYGDLQGLVTATDILEAIVGELAEEDEAPEPEIIQREDGSWLLDGGLSIDHVQELLKLPARPDGGDFSTLAGLVLDRLEHVPISGEHFNRDGYRFEIIDMDGRRIDKVLVSRIEPGGR